MANLISMLNDIIYMLVMFITSILELMGIFIISYSSIKTFYFHIKSKFKVRDDLIKLKFARELALALEFKLASEILKTVVVRDMEEIYFLMAIIVLRVILTFVIHWEIKACEIKSD